MTMDLLDVAWNDDIIEDIQVLNYDTVAVYSRDWTVETINNQVAQGNIDLNPRFQRRNAWNDQKRSRLIESLIIGAPIPQIVLAENPNKKKSFLVIDGKQRLLTVSGYLNPEIPYWTRNDLTGLRARSNLNGVTYETLKTNPEWADAQRALLNADIRCTVISNYEQNDILYDIFYRLNTGSVPLSTQELRQVLYKGDFANALVSRTDNLLPIHHVLNLDEPDPRLRDVEIILRSLALEAFGGRYRGNLKRFLDDAMRNLSREWDTNRPQIENALHIFDQATQRAISVLSENRVGRKYSTGHWEGRFNKSVFEVELYYFARVPDAAINEENNRIFVEGFQQLCENNARFKSSIETTTKTNENYVIRFEAMRDLINRAYHLEIMEIPVTNAG